MKIVQSFAKYEEGLHPTKYRKKFEYYYLNYYSFLLSYITLKERYGSVTMFCNQGAYDSIIKYIPYDDVVIKENDNPFIMWSKYKLDCIRMVDEDLIHVDSDVFILNDLFRPFIDSDYDVMVQNVFPRPLNTVNYFGFEQREFLKESKILTKPYDGNCFSCGTLGLKKRAKEIYFAGIDILYEAMLKTGLENFFDPPMILEEQLLYFISIENNLNVHRILSDDLISKSDDIINEGDKIGYLHVWYDLKYKRNIIQQIRRKLFHDYPEYLDHLFKFEQEEMIWKRIFRYMVLPDNYLDVDLDAL
jgi:hypothetical protein